MGFITARIAGRIAGALVLEVPIVKKHFKLILI